MSAKGISPEGAVNIERATFSYESGKKSQNVLDNVTIDIPKGIIYALLGPSGCGKTTLLKAISNRLKLNNGTISLFGVNNEVIDGTITSKIGYMPQEIAVIPELTVEETLYFFGGIHNLSKQALKEQVHYLIELLDLPKGKHLVKFLSGGQKRRVSFAAAMVHCPPLLVLDEPTVGVDPLLRQVIWKHLSKLTRHQNTTVLITTHYIEEAKEANMIALMRMGKILVEAPPNDLLACMAETKLETCFMKICAMDEDVQSNKPTNDNSGSVLHKESVTNLRKKMCSKTIKESPTEIRPPNLEHSNRRNEPLLQTSILIRRNFRILRRNPVLFLSQFLGPALQILSFCVCVGHNLYDLPLAIVNEESPPLASRVYLEKINNYTITQIPYNSLDSGINSVRTRDSLATIHIHSNFTKCLFKKMQMGLNVDNETISCSSIKGHFDTTNKQILGTLQRSLFDAYTLFQKEMLTMVGASINLAKMPLEFVTPVYGDLDVTFTEFVLPAVIQTTCYFMAVALTAITFLLEKKTGVLDRMFVAGITFQQVIISHTVTQLFVVMGQVILTLLIPIFVFKIPFYGSLYLATASCLLQGVCGMSFGLLISAVTTKENEALIFAMALLYPNVFFSGYFWPLEGMPVTVRKFAYLFPLTLPTEGLRAMSSRGWGIGHRAVWIGFVSTSCWILICLCATLIVLKIKNRK